jgi:hypothetical protein
MKESARGMACVVHYKGSCPQIVGQHCNSFTCRKAQLHRAPDLRATGTMAAVHAR